MSRRVITTELQTLNGVGPADTYFDKVVKYIPADIIAAWVTVSGLVKDRTDIDVPTVMWIAFAVGVLLTPLWTWKQTTMAGVPPVKRQIAIATIAFIVWTIALAGEPFTSIHNFHPIFGSLLLIAYTLIVGLLEP